LTILSLECGALDPLACHRDFYNSSPGEFGTTEATKGDLTQILCTNSLKENFLADSKTKSCFRCIFWRYWFCSL